jgi:TadE-like protein
MRRILRQLGRADGAEIAEAALVLPVVFLFLMGIVWFGRAFQIYATITRAAQQGAIVAARPACAVGCGNSFPSDTTVENSVNAVMQASSLDPSQIIKPPNPVVQDCPDPVPAHTCSGANITICRQVVLNPASTPAQCGTIVTFHYPFQFILPFSSLNMQPIVLKAQAQSRMEN